MARYLNALASQPKTVVGIAIGSLIAVTLWMFSQVFVPPSSRACQVLYRQAATAADTARVDGTVPDPLENRSREARSCGAIRHSARWF